MNLRTFLTARALPAAAALLLFFLAAVIAFTPQFRGEVLPQHDVLQYESSVQDIRAHRAATGEDPQWTGSMFGGMPAYLLNVAYPAQLVKHLAEPVVGIVDTPAGFLFFACVSMWLMLLMMGIDSRVAIAGALAYGLSTYFFLIIGAGHITKMWALVYAPLMMGGAWMTLRGDMWCGGAVTALAASLEIGANHPQITYYFLLAMGALWLSEAVASLRSRSWRPLLRRTGVLAMAGVLAAASNFAPLWYTAQHTGDTIRGGSELAADAERSGLDPDYATAWSYGPAESFTLLVPDFMGGSSTRGFAPDGEVAAALTDYGLRDVATQLPAYWGDQPFTAGPTYLGAAALFLAVLGFLLADNRWRWWLLGISAFMLLLAWGRHIMGFTQLMFRLLPGYDKFRTVSMALVVVQWTVPLLATLALMRLWRGDIPPQRLRRALAWAAGIAGGLCLVLAAGGSLLSDFGREASAATMTAQFRQLFTEAGMERYAADGTADEMGLAAPAAMASERASMMRADAWRSLLFVLLAAGAVWLYVRGRIGRGMLTAAAGLLMAVDLLAVDLRFLPHDSFGTARSQRVALTDADRTILADKEPGFRVLNLTVSPFNDATTSWHHRSVGGYHGAKLARYQDLIDRYLAAGHDGVLDMLDTRYLIVPRAGGGTEAVRRETANGAAWFVAEVAGAETPRDEIELLGAADLKRTAVVAARDLRRIAPRTCGAQGGRIALAEYRPNYQRYEYTAPEEAVAVFSEIWYDKGWTATIDGAPAEAFRADYVLRGMVLPAGTHTVEWRFRAPAWRTTEGVTLAASLAILAGCAACLVRALLRRRKGSAPCA